MDAAFLKHLNLSQLTSALRDFWPNSGPRWDGLARSGKSVVLVEAKAHLKEALSSPSTATDPASVKLIEASLEKVKTALGADNRSNWTRCFYQYTNRLAHLWWLREQKIDAELLLVGFLNDTEMGGPATVEAWHGIYLAAHHALGLSEGHGLQRHIHHVHPDVTLI